jgi:hypothetical protein
MFLYHIVIAYDLFSYSFRYHLHYVVDDILYNAILLFQNSSGNDITIFLFNFYSSNPTDART